MASIFSKTETGSDSLNAPRAPGNRGMYGSISVFPYRGNEEICLLSGDGQREGSDHSVALMHSWCFLLDLEAVWMKLWSCSEFLEKYGNIWCLRGFRGNVVGWLLVSVGSRWLRRSGNWHASEGSGHGTWGTPLSWHGPPCWLVVGARSSVWKNWRLKVDGQEVATVVFLFFFLQQQSFFFCFP